MPDWTQLEQLAIDTIRLCASCHNATPIRFFATEDVPIFRAERNCIGFTQSELDTIVRPYLIDPSPAGRFFAIAYSRAQCLNAYGLEDPRFNYRFVAMALHEVSHIIEGDFAELHRFRPLPASAIQADARKIAARGVCDLAAMTKSERIEFDRELLQVHADEFTRVALHMLWRAKHLHGFSRLTAGLVVDYAAGRSHPDAYLDAIGDEPDRCRHWTFEEIRALPAPPKFNDLWNRDFRAAMERRPTTENVMSASIDRIITDLEKKQSEAAQKERDRQAAASDAWFKLVDRSYANKETISTTEVEAVLKQADKTLADLRQALAWRHHRANLRKTVEARGAVPALLKDIEARREAERKKMLKAETDFKAAFAQLADEETAAYAIQTRANEAESELRRDAGGEFNARRMEIGREKVRLEKLTSDLRQVIGENEARNRPNLKELRAQITSEEAYAKDHPGSVLDMIVKQRKRFNDAQDALAVLIEEEREIARQVDIVTFSD